MTRRSTTLRERRLAKVAELPASAVSPPRCWGWRKVSERTLERVGRVAGQRIGGCIDGQWLRAAAGIRVTGQLREAIFAVRPKTRMGSGSR